MLKKFLLTAFLVGFAFSADAQIATPQLDSGYHTYGGAAAGWRYGNTVAITAISAEGKTEYEGEEGGDVVAGLNAVGPEDSSSPIPFALAAFRGETIAAELYSNLGDGIKTDVEENENSNFYQEEKELRFNLAYVISETVSIGLGYYSMNYTSKSVKDSTEDSTDLTTTGTSLSASVRLADIFFVAGGMETVNQVGTYDKKGSEPSSGDFVENSWTNTMFGLGIVTGDPGDTQFRVEYSMINSPESEKTETGKAPSEHPETKTTFVSAEAKFGEFLIGYLSETEKQAEIGGKKEVETITTSMGVGWVPREGLSVSLYSLNNKRTDKQDIGESTANLTGFRFFVGYNF